MATTAVRAAPRPVQTSAPAPTVEPPSNTIRSTSLSDFLNRPRPRYLVKNLLPRHGAGIAFGETGAGKTFIALDLAMCVARGEPWRGHPVQHAGVVYLCSEGVSGFVERLRAYLQHHHLQPDEIAIEVIVTAVDLLNPGEQLDELGAAIHDASERIGPVGLVVIDTLNRTMPGGDENSPEDMSAYVANVSKVAETVGAFALIVHHAGKDPARGARGHSSLKAAVDVEIEVSRTEAGERVATLTKARDFESGARFGFLLQVIELGTDEDGDAITSCVVVPTDAPPEQQRRSRELSGVARVALQALGEAIVEHGETMPATSTIPPGVPAVKIEQWRARFEVRYGSDGRERKAGSLTKAFTRGKEQLLQRGAIVISEPFAWRIGA